MRFLTVEELNARQRRQERLLWLAGACVVVLVLVLLITTGPADITIGGGA